MKNIRKPLKTGKHRIFRGFSYVFVEVCRTKGDKVTKMHKN